MADVTQTVLYSDIGARDVKQNHGLNVKKDLD